MQKPQERVGDILSEGEHRCVALAAFLAELATIKGCSAIVFDDPVSSLDHMHREAMKVVGGSPTRIAASFGRRTRMLPGFPPISHVARKRWASSFRFPQAGSPNSTKPFWPMPHTTEKWPSPRRRKCAMTGMPSCLSCSKVSDNPIALNPNFSTACLRSAKDAVASS